MRGKTVRMCVHHVSACAKVKVFSLTFLVGPMISCGGRDRVEPLVTANN